jgi:replication-associated recombination protein RarA
MNTQYKYRPQRIEDYVFATDRLERQIMRYISGHTSRPLVLHGKYGTGKSTLADLIPKAIDGPAVVVTKIKSEYLNSNDEVRKLFIRSKQFDKFFTHEGQSRNYIVVEEVNFDPRAKSALRDSLDEMEGRDLTIFTTNEVAKIDDGLLSRAEVVEVPPAPPDRFLKHAQKILLSEGVYVADAAVLEVLESVFELHRDNRAYYKALDEIIESNQKFTDSTNPESQLVF